MTERLILFPGSVKEYEILRGYKVEIIDTGKNDKGVYYNPLDNDLINLIKEKGIEALVNISFRSVGRERENSTHSVHYGLPVKKQKTL